MSNFKQFRTIWTNKCKNTEYKSLSIWEDNVIVSSTNSEKIKLFNKENGKYIKNLKTKKKFFTLQDPQDEIVINDFLFITDNKQSMCSIYSMTDNIPVAIFGFKNLENPKGLTGYYNENKYYLYIIDDKTNNIIKYIINIENNQITNLESELFIKLEYTKIESILIDFELKKILAYSSTDSKIIVFNMNGQKINEIMGEAESIVIYKQYYLFTDKSIDSNMIHLYDRNTLTYNSSFFNGNVKFINDVYVSNDEIFIIDNKCSLSKINLELETSTNSNFLLSATICFILYKMLS